MVQVKIALLSNIGKEHAANPSYVWVRRSFRIAFRFIVAMLVRENLHIPTTIPFSLCFPSLEHLFILMIVPKMLQLVSDFLFVPKV